MPLVPGLFSGIRSRSLSPHPPVRKKKWDRGSKASDELMLASEEDEHLRKHALRRRRSRSVSPRKLGERSSAGMEDTVVIETTRGTSARSSLNERSMKHQDNPLLQFRNTSASPPKSASSASLLRDRTFMGRLRKISAPSKPISPRRNDKSTRGGSGFEGEEIASDGAEGDFSSRPLLPPVRPAISSPEVVIWDLESNQSYHGGQGGSGTDSDLMPSNSNNNSASEKGSCGSKGSRGNSNAELNRRSDGVVLSSKENLKNDSVLDGSTHSRSSSPKPSRGDRDRSSKSGPSGRIQSAASQLKNFLAPNYKTRSDEFKKLFPTAPPTEKFVIDYSCAFQREILVHGRMYLSQGSLCFYANIFKWETTISISFKDIQTITKERTAKVIPNAIQVVTLNGEKYFFTSFGSRDKSYMALFKLWQSALLDQNVSPADLWSFAQHGYDREDLGSDNDEEQYYHDDPDPCTDGSCGPNMSGLSNGENSVTQSQGLGASAGGSNGAPPKFVIEAGPDAELSSPSGLDPVQGSGKKRRKNKAQRNQMHAPPFSSTPAPDDFTESSDNEAEVTCPCASHEGQELMNNLYPISVDQMFILLFTDSNFYKEYMEYRNAVDSVMTDWKHNKGTGEKTREVRFTLNLNHSMGPRSTAVTEKQSCYQHGKSGQIYVIKCEAQNAGIPYADSFKVVTTYCMSRVSANQCRVRCHGNALFKKNIWGIVRSFIEKNTSVGMQEHFTDLDFCLRRECERLGLPSAPNLAPGRVERGKQRRRTSSRRRSGREDEPEPVSSGPPSPTPRTTGNTGKAQSILPREVESIAKVILLVMVVMLLLNGLLFYKLWSMETESSKNRGFQLDYSMGELRLLLQKSELSREEAERVYRFYRGEAALRWQETLKGTMQSLLAVENQLRDLRMQLERAELNFQAFSNHPERDRSVQDKSDSIGGEERRKGRTQTEL